MHPRIEASRQSRRRPAGNPGRRGLFILCVGIGIALAAAASAGPHTSPRPKPRPETAIVAPDIGEPECIVVSRIGWRTIHRPCEEADQ